MRLFIKHLLYLLIFLTSFNSFSQKRGIYFINKKTGTSRFIEENRRIKIYLNNGEKTIGRYKIIDEKIIKIRSNFIPVDSIMKIRKKTITSTIFSSLLISTSTLFLSAIISSQIKEPNPFIAVVIPPTVLIGSIGVFIPKIYRNYKKKEWDFELKTGEDKISN